MKIENAAIYVDSTDYVGTAEVTLPDIERLSDTIKGFGIMGEIDVISKQLKAMSLKLKFNVTNDLTEKLLAPKQFTFDIRGVATVYDSSTAEFSEVGLKFTIKATNKKGTGGKLAPGEKMDSEMEFSVTYYKSEIDGTTTAEIDIPNYKQIIDGTDYMENQRSLLGKN